jgi:chromosome segregation ATPase
MNELALSNNLAQIELEINHHKQIAGQSIWEIGRRLNHVKEHDLTHGQFMEWIEKIGIYQREANRMMKVASELPNSTTLSNLGTSALYLIATLPDDQKQEQLNRIEEGDNPTVRELQELRRQLNLSKADNEELRQKNEQLAEQALAKFETKIVTKEVAPQDYDSTKSLNKTLMEKNKKLKSDLESLEERNKFVESQYQSLLKERETVDANSKKYEELTEAIQQSKGQLNDVQKKMSDYKDILEIVRSGDDLLTKMSGLIYKDEEKFRQADHVIGLEIDSLVNRMQLLINDLSQMRGAATIIEGEFK